jgi:hypothetical protein
MTYSKPLGGLFFGLAFFIIAYKTRIFPLRYYLILSGIGLVLYFTSSDVIVLTNLTYPPFGTLAISFLGLSSFLIYLGLYCSALLVANDSNIRREIQMTLSRDLKLVHEIGLSELNENVTRKVSKISKEFAHELKQETGAETSLGDDEVKRYISEVLEELNRHSKKKSNPNLG